MGKAVDIDRVTSVLVTWLQRREAEYRQRGSDKDLAAAAELANVVAGLPKRFATELGVVVKVPAKKDAPRPARAKESPTP